MAYEISKTGEIKIGGFENGIASSPHMGFGNMQGVNIATETGEVMCSYNRIKQTQTGTTGTLTRINTNTVSISGITLLVGQIITILVDSGTGLSGNYYYLSTGKLFAGSLPPNDPSTATPVTGINAGTATFSITYPLGNPIMSATEIYFDPNVVTQYRYYILDSLGQVWCHDTATIGGGFDTPLWFFVGICPDGAGASGLAVLNGWLTISRNYTIWWKLTVLLGNAFSTIGGIALQSNQFHSTLTGHQGKLYETDGTHIMSLFPNTSLLTGASNVQSYMSYVAALTGERVTNGSFTGSAAGWTLGAAWQYGSNNVVKFQDGTTTLSQNIGSTSSQGWYVTFTVSAYSAGTVTPAIGAVSGTGVTANGTYTQFIVADVSGGNLTFTPTNTARFTIDDVSVKTYAATTTLIAGSGPNVGVFVTRVPVIFYTNGTLPTAIMADTVYWVTWGAGSLTVYDAQTNGNQLDLITGALGLQYFNTFSPTSGGSTAYTYTAQRFNLPFFETATCMVELGNLVIIGGKGNVLYPWDQISTLPFDLINLPENNTVNLITVNNMVYVFTGQKGNIYITNGASASLAIKVPDYCAGIAGTPASYVEPYFTWGGAMYLRGRVWFSILDQTATKAGNCGGIWSFIPTQSFAIEQDTGLSLRLENQSSYGTYSGVSQVLLASQTQTGMGPQYWTGWYSSLTSPTYGIDFSDTVTTPSAVIETDLIPTGFVLQKQTYSQIFYKLSTPLAAGESVLIAQRQNSTDSYVSAGTIITESTTSLSGYLPVNFEKGQWLQLKVTLNPLATSSSSFVRLKELTVKP